MRIGLVAGEASGDVLGAGLMRSILAVRPDARFEGVVGPQMRAAGAEAWAESEELAVFGLFEPLKVLPRLLRLRRSLVQRWTENPPDVFVGIDAPEFNIGLELRLRRRGVRTVQYVSPQVWAWRRRRVRKIGRAVDLVLCLLPFEKTFYDRHGVASEVVGHPLADTLPADLDRPTERRALGVDAKLQVTVMPGSRAGEVKRLGPVFVDAVKHLADQFDSIAFVAPMANSNARSVFEEQLATAGATELVRLTDGDATRVIAAADVVLLASGTAALQAALLERPIVAAYKVAPPTYYMAQMLQLLKVEHFTLPNLLTPEPLVPEFLQHEANPEALAGAVSELLADAGQRGIIEAEFGKLRDRLGLGADQRAAAAVIGLAERDP